MRCGKTIHVVLLASLSALVPVLSSAATAVEETSPGEPSPYHATAQQQAAAFLRKEVSELIEPVLSDFPEDAYLTLVAVKLNQQCKHPRRVMALLQEGLNYNPANFNLNNTAAKVAFTNGDYEKAVLYGQKALAINPKNPTVHEDLAHAMLFSGQYQEAVEVLEKKITLFSGSERTYRLLGKSHMLLKHYEQAKDYYEKAIESNPSSTIADCSTMSKLYMQLKQPEKAKEYMKLHSELTAQKKIRDLEDAGNQKDRIVLDSTDSEVLVFSKALARLCIRGRLLYRNKYQPEKGEKLFTRSEDIFTESISIAPDAADIYREFADMYVTTGKKLSEALPLAQKALELEASAENYFVLGRAFYRQLDTGRALWALEQALKLEPQNQAIRQAYSSIMEKGLQ
jgi:tetratricopeptide (TPR) repeat protein